MVMMTLKICRCRDVKGGIDEVLPLPQPQSQPFLGRGAVATAPVSLALEPQEGYCEMCGNCGPSDAGGWSWQALMVVW